TIRALGGTLKAIHIHDLDSGTFFAKLVIERDGETVEVDSRPSDAIALGVADGVPILVDDRVLDEAVSDAVIEPPPAVEPDEDGDEE
ncbi:MAG: bifunctional nuclease family protein, partial [Proteobacteria bacterium]|nr:bifunctional nuclease family protein [Pseudomonadota bacterium]